jgi:pimeloyl-[acyl-carrier protein] methyl ester esterase
MWRGQVEILPGATVAPDLYSMGDSMEAWAQGVLATQPDGPLILVGSSMGGSCALEMARLAGDRIAAIVLVGSKAAHHPEPRIRDGYVASLREGGLPRLWPNLASRFFGSSADIGVVEAAQELASEQTTEDLVRATQVFHMRPDAAEVLARWQKPLLVINGDEDGFVSVEKAAGLTTSAPLGRVHIMRGCGHFPNLDRPHEFNSIVSDVVKLCQSSRSSVRHLRTPSTPST